MRYPAFHTGLRKQAKVDAAKAASLERRRVRQIAKERGDRLRRLPKWTRRRIAQAGNRAQRAAGKAPGFTSETAKLARAKVKHNKRKLLITLGNRKIIKRTKLRTLYAYKLHPICRVGYWPELKVWIGPGEDPAMPTHITISETTAIKLLTQAGALVEYGILPVRLPGHPKIVTNQALLNLSIDESNPSN